MFSDLRLLHPDLTVEKISFRLIQHAWLVTYCWVKGCYGFKCSRYSVLPGFLDGDWIWNLGKTLPERFLLKICKGLGYFVRFNYNFMYFFIGIIIQNILY